MLKDLKDEDAVECDAIVDLGAASERTRAIGNYGVEPNMEPLTFK